MNNDTRSVLERPFTSIKTRPGRNGKQLSYIEGGQVIDRLNEAFGQDWSFRVIDHQIGNGEVVVLGELEADGIIKQAFGGSEITKSRDGGRPICVSDDLKSAATDSLKKAATLLGVALHLYCDTTAERTPALKNVETPRGNGSHEPQPANGRLTRRQYAYIQKLARDRGLDRGQLESLSRERFGKVSSHVSQQQASSLIDELQGGRDATRHAS